MSQERLKALQSRALMLQKARAFFEERAVLEVDPCALSRFAAIDSNIDVICASVSEQERGFLHTSPEYAMKQLISSGCGDMYFLGHVFRKGEIGRLHNPEFTMAEWYRLGFSYDQMIQETCEFLFLFLGVLPIRKLKYREAFQHYAGLNYTRDDLRAHLPPNGASWSKDTAVHYLLTHVVEPELGRGELTVITHYPPHEAALACVVEDDGERVAERFEIYYQGIELANGYHELGDAKQLRARFAEENQTRLSQGKEMYLLDEGFLTAMGRHFPDCSGVAVGFDRALMLHLNAASLREVLPFTWN